MAFKVADGFDHYKDPNLDMLSRSGFLQWQVPAGSALSSFITGRNGHGQCLQFAGTNLFPGPVNPLRGVWAVRNQEQFIGVALKLPSGTGGPPFNVPSGFWFAFVDTVAGAYQVTIQFDYTNFAIRAWRGAYNGTSLGISANNVWAGDTWNFIEFRIKIDGATGVVHVRVNGVDALVLTGINTKATANAWTDAVDLALQTSTLNATCYAWIDDVYYCDTASDPGASPNNTFMNDVGVDTLFPTGDGTVQWTRNGGASNFGRVNEVPMDGDTTYNASANPGDEDQLTFQPITNVVPIIYAVQVTVAARKDDVGPRVIKTGLKSGATVSYGANHSLPSTYVYFTDPWVLDPNTSANWTRTAVNNLLGLYNLVS